jgi:hypothetical protein
MASNANHTASGWRISLRHVSRPRWPAVVPSYSSPDESEMQPGTGAERTLMGQLACVLGWKAGYQPRHRSPRWGYTESAWLAQQELEDPLTEPNWSALGQDFSADEAWTDDDAADADFLDQLTSGQIRRMLENYAINDEQAGAVPDLVQTIAHSSHTDETLTSAWDEFHEAVRDAHALHLSKRAWWEFFCRQDLGSCPQEEAVEIKLNDADDAWCLIMNGSS